jgi:pimeloyl-ACP methyl ester carboxylesterase
MIEPVEIAARDGTILRGELRRGGPDGVVLVHDRGRDLDAWRDLPAALVEEGLGVLAFDLRGHGGSDGDADAAMDESDIADAVMFAREAGFERVYVGAEGASAGAALASAGHAAFVLAPRDLVGEFPRPALVLLPKDDPLDGMAAEHFPGDSLVITVPESPPLLERSWADNVRDYVVRFLREMRLRP